MLDVVVDAVAERMLRYDPAGEFDFHDDFGWLDITHGITYANAVRWHAAHLPAPGHGAARAVVRVPGPLDRPPRVAHAGRRRSTDRPRHDDVAAAGEALQREALDDTTTAFIVHAHAVKTTRGGDRGGGAHRVRRARCEAVARFLGAPKLERFVAATVTRSIDFVAGRTRRDD